jgi:hypothetical protein
VRTERLMGHIAFGGGSEHPLRVEILRGGRMREEIGLDAGVLILVTDGTEGWRLAPGDTAAVALPADALRNMAGGADLDGPLVNRLKKHNRVERVGRDSVAGRAAWKLKVTQKSGDVRYDWIDCETGLELKWAGTIQDNGKTFDVESVFGDYRDVGGIKIAHRIDSETQGTNNRQRIILENVEVNVPLGGSRFTRPAVPRRGAAPDSSGTRRPTAVDSTAPAAPDTSAHRDH